MDIIFVITKSEEREHFSSTFYSWGMKLVNIYLIAGRKDFLPPDFYLGLFPPCGPVQSPGHSLADNLHLPLVVAAKSVSWR